MKQIRVIEGIFIIASWFSNYTGIEPWPYSDDYISSLSIEFFWYAKVWDWTCFGMTQSSCSPCWPSPKSIKTQIDETSNCLNPKTLCFPSHNSYPQIPPKCNTHMTINSARPQYGEWRLVTATYQYSNDFIIPSTKVFSRTKVYAIHIIKFSLT
jgi:hypothetical protein